MNLPVSQPSSQIQKLAKADWQRQMQGCIRSLPALLQYKPELASHPLIASALSQTELRQAELRMSITPYYASLIDETNPNCPILKQSLPTKSELQGTLFSEKDPLAEESHMPVPGLTHRYPDRVLWYLTHSCAVYCRYCLRRRKVSDPRSSPNLQNKEQALDYIQKHPAIKEVILSGGDPLAIGDAKISDLLFELKKIPHLRSIRIHSRMPVTLPQRITKELAAIFQKNYPLTLVTHFNHPVEITKEARKAVRRLRMAGLHVLNQSVLLRGINDKQAILEELFLGLLEIGVLPYYLHRCDEIPGTEHFQTPLLLGRKLLANLQGRNPGIALPRYMIDLPGGGGKVPFGENYYLGTETQNKAADSSREPRMGGIRKYLFSNFEGKIFRTKENI